VLNSKNILTGKRIAVPESRQLDLLAGMLKKRGASVRRCPLVAICDSPETDKIIGWIEGCITQPYDDLILFTGEGLKRLLGFAQRCGRRDAFIESLAQMCLITRGPKPVQALKQIGLKPDIVAQTPTTDGVIAMLERMDLEHCRVAVQLYADDPNVKLVDYLKNRNARISTVAPYRYAPDSDEQEVAALINEIVTGLIDAMAFTSQPQLKRLLDVAGKLGRLPDLNNAMSRIVIAAVGPLVAQAIQAAGWPVHVMPESNYFMKPMVTELAEKLNESK
jgi:uroporphyrinogen-III synthase